MQITADSMGVYTKVFSLSLYQILMWYDNGQFSGALRLVPLSYL